jgi:hypothetical protein
MKGFESLLTMWQCHIAPVSLSRFEKLGFEKSIEYMEMGIPNTEQKNFLLLLNCCAF